MEKYLVRDIMIPLEKYPHITRACTLRQAVVEMDKCQIVRGERQSLPRVVLVFSENLSELCGMVRRRDILRGLTPRFLIAKPIEHTQRPFEIQIDPNLSEIAFDRMVRGIHKQADRPVSEVMIPIRAVVDYEDHLMKAIYEMVNMDTSLLPVIKEGKVAGVIRSVDVLHEVYQIIAKGPSV